MSAKGASSHSAADILNDVRHKILLDHNKYRQKHHVPQLVPNSTLDQIAQNWSDQLLSTRILKHRPSTKFGENLWAGSNFTIEDLKTGKANPVGSWYAEINNYPSASFEKYGHFTQLVWKSSKYIGCGISYDPEAIFVVCNYDPPGNWEGLYHENVFTVDGAPWGNNPKETPDSKKEDSGGGGSEEAPGEDAANPTYASGEEIEEPPTPYWLYGLGLAIILLVVVFLAILIYYQKS